MKRTLRSQKEFSDQNTSEDENELELEEADINMISNSEFIDGATKLHNCTVQKRLEMIEDEIETLKEKLLSEKQVEIDKEIQMIQKGNHPVVKQTLKELDIKCEELVKESQKRYDFETESIEHIYKSMLHQIDQSVNAIHNERKLVIIRELEEKRNQIEFGKIYFLF